MSKPWAQKTPEEKEAFRLYKAEYRAKHREKLRAQANAQRVA